MEKEPIGLELCIRFPPKRFPPESAMGQRLNAVPGLGTAKRQQFIDWGTICQQSIGVGQGNVRMENNISRFMDLI